MKEDVYYGDYLQLDKILGAQAPKSEQAGSPAHDETLFIIIHQTYELWFKQILFEIDSVKPIMREKKARPAQLAKVVARLERVTEIQKILIDQLQVIETMTPLDFMDFRDFLTPASGFQSVQFRLLEIHLGLNLKNRTQVERNMFNARLKESDLKILEQAESEDSLLKIIEKWLEAMPFAEYKEFNFWEQFKANVAKMLKNDEKIISTNSTLSEFQQKIEISNLKATAENFDNLFDDKKYQKLLDSNLCFISRKAKLNALFISLFRDEPILQMPWRLIESLIDIDELFTTWRYRHSIMAHRLLGTKIGTGGSSGHEYLKKAAENNRIFLDFFNLATFLLPKSQIPMLPQHLVEELGFKFNNEKL